MEDLVFIAYYFLFNIITLIDTIIIYTSYFKLDLSTSSYYFFII